MNGNGIIHINRNAGSPTRHPSRNKSNDIIFLAYPFVAAILSGIVCYHLGKLSTASSWDKIDDADIQQKEDASPYYLQSNNGMIGIHNNREQKSQHKHNATTSYAAASDPKNDRRLVPRDNMNCGKPKMDRCDGIQRSCDDDSLIHVLNFYTSLTNIIIPDMI